ncbi:MAG: transposase family protein [Sandaracinaceae bacterium]|nr:transposase family protein [Sandaracinaceae bacterium]
MGRTRLRRVALFFLDDATRKGLQVVVGTEEDTALFLRGVFELLRRHGRMDALYLDKGTAFTSDDTAAVFAQLGLPLIFGQTRYPEGHGKIERFHQTAIRKVLRGLDGAIDVDPDCGALELRLSHYLERYDATPHESLGHRDEHVLVRAAALRASHPVAAGEEHRARDAGAGIATDAGTAAGSGPETAEADRFGARRSRTPGGRGRSTRPLPTHPRLR